jgi:hypothetical protein
MKDVPKDIPIDKILYLEASVVCTTQPSRKVFICEGCVLREVNPFIRRSTADTLFLEEKSPSQKRL